MHRFDRPTGLGGFGAGKRRAAVWSALSAALLGVLVAAPVRAAEPIRIGFLAPLTGVVAAGGKDMVDGWNLWWKQHGDTAAGRQIEIIVEDDASNPDTALNKARRLVQQRNVHMLVGNLLANTGIAVAEYVKTTGTPYFIPIIAADDLTQRKRIPNVIRVAGFTSSQTTRPLADWALKQGYRRVVTIAQDYTFGHEQVGGFAQLFSEGGGEILAQLWHPLNTADLGPYLAEVQRLKPDAVTIQENGADAVRFIKQWSDFGLKGKLPLISSSNGTDQAVIRGLGEEPVGLISSSHYAEGRDSPATRKFVEDFDKEYGKLPSFFAAATYTAGMWLTKAIDDVKGDVENREAFLAAVRRVELPDSPLGPARLDAYGNPVYTVDIRKVVRRPDGRLWNVPIASYQNVSQFWTYVPEEYMKQPSYSRDFQGIKKK